MRLLLVCLLLVPCVGICQSSNDEPVNVRDLIPDIVIDLRYNQTNNFLNQKLYSTDECLLAASTAQALKRVQDTLRTQGIGIKIWDGYRPRAVQYLMWEIFPNSTYVADPAVGSNHNRGAAVDVTLVDLATGLELPMPTTFDFFGPESWHSNMNLPPNIIANRALLRSRMEYAGFRIISTEWWHYDYVPALSLPLLDFQMK